MRRTAAGLVFGVAVALSATARAQDPAPDSLLLDTLLGLDAAPLFPDGTYSPLAERQALDGLYARYRDAALDAKGSEESILRFAFIGWVARMRNDSAMSEAFKPDFKTLADRNPSALFTALAKAPFLVEPSCATLAEAYFFGDNAPAGRFDWIARVEQTGRAALGTPDWAKCAVAFYAAGP